MAWLGSAGAHAALIAVLATTAGEPRPAAEASAALPVVLFATLRAPAIDPPPPAASPAPVPVPAAPARPALRPTPRPVAPAARPAMAPPAPVDPPPEGAEPAAAPPDPGTRSAEPGAAPVAERTVAAAAPPAAQPEPSAEPPLITTPRFRHPPAPAAYPARARAGNQQGTVLVRVLIGPDGKPRQIRIWETSGFHLLDAAAEAAVRGWQFEPASSNGRDIEAWVQVPVHFALR